MAKGDRFYFENFAAAAADCCAAAQYLEECLTHYDYSKIEDMMHTLHAIEHSADGKRHDMVEALAKAFVTPLDREDLAEISHDIDDVVDCIDGILQRFYVDRIEKVLPSAVEFAGKIAEGCDLMKAIVAELPNFKKPQKLKELIRSMGHLEEECDKLYLTATRAIPDQTSDILEILGWRDILAKMEKCIDCCERVADSIEIIVMKNT